MLDLLVIGAGLAGLSAAITAAEAGLRVRVIAKGHGITHWHAGTIDLLGYLATPDGEQLVTTPYAARAQLPAEHPYCRLEETQLAAALTRFQAWLAGSDLVYAGAAQSDHNLLLPTAVGSARPTFLAPQAQLAGDLSHTTPLLIVGIRGLRDFYPHLIAENLNKLGYRARAAFIDWEVITPQRDRNVVHLAGLLDQPDVQARVIRALKPLVRPDERIGFPAIVGLERHREGWQRLQNELGTPLFEIATLPPSVPGIRLFHALRRRLQQLGGRIEIGMEAIGFTSQGDQITAVQTATSARPLHHRAGQFVLATGGWLGGGFFSDHTGRSWETIFQLPLAGPQDRAEWFHPQFLHPQGQPIFRKGVRVNEDWQPLNADQQPVYANLRAVGNLLAQIDPLRERSIEGVAISTGIAAVQRLVAGR